MADNADLEFDPEFAAVVKRNPTAALVIEVRYLRRDVNAIDAKVEKVDAKVQGMQKQCPCKPLIDLTTDVAAIKGEDKGREKSGNNVIAWVGVLISVTSVAILVLSKVF